MCGGLLIRMHLPPLSLPPQSANTYAAQQRTRRLLRGCLRLLALLPCLRLIPCFVLLPCAINVVIVAGGLLLLLYPVVPAFRFEPQRCVQAGTMTVSGSI